jgi:hypothetical protein
VVLEVRQGSLLDARDRRPETVRAMLRTFRLASGVKSRIDQSLPLLLQDPNLLGAGMSYLTESQAAALHNALG